MMAAPLFVKQPTNQTSLHKDKQKRGQKFCPVLLYYSPGAEIDFASRGDLIRADAPPDHLAPIVFGAGEAARLHFDLLRPFASHYTNANRSSLPAYILHGIHRAAHRAVAEKAPLRGED